MSDAAARAGAADDGYRRRRLVLDPRSAASLVPLAATVLAFLIGGLVVADRRATTRSPPTRRSSKARASTGSSPGSPATRATDAARDLQQTLIVTTPLILTALAVAFAFRCGLFNIGGQGQYWVGLIAALWIGTHLEGLPRPLHVLARARRRRSSAGAIWGGIAGILKADRRRARGDHDDHAQLDRDLRRAVPLRARRPAPGRRAVASHAPTSARVGQALADLGRASSRSTPASSSRSSRSSSTTCSSTGRRSATRCARSASTPRPPATAASPSPRNYFLALGDLRRFAGLAGAVDLLGWQVRRRRRATSTRASIGFTGIAVALLGRNKAVGILFAALLFGGAPGRDVDAPARPERLPARARRQPRDDDPGARHLLRRRRAPHRLHLAGAQAARFGRRRARPARSVGA